MSTAKEFCQTVIKILQIANGQHRKILSVATLARLLESVNAGDRVAWGWSSRTTHGYGRGHPAVVAICFRKRDGEVVLGVAEGWDKHSSPGRAWKSLKPWRPGTAGTTRKLEIWAKETASDRLAIPERVVNEVIALLWRADPGAQIP